jgi:hypothetical protein
VLSADVSWWVKLTAIGAIATAVFTLGAVVLALISHRHFRAVQGERRPVLARPTRSSHRVGTIWAPNDTPGDWCRFLILDLTNRSDIPQYVTLVGDSVRIGRWRPWHRCPVSTKDGPVAALDGKGNGQFNMMLLRGRDWPYGQHPRVKVRMEVHGAEPVRFTGRVRLFPVDDRPERYRESET